MKRSLLGVLAMTLLMTRVPAVFAAPTDLSDVLNVFDATGAVVYSIFATEGDEAANPPNTIYYINVAGLVDPAQFGKATFVFESPGQLSDIFGVAEITGVPFLVLGFASDSSTGPPAFPPPGPGAIVVSESDGPFDATMYLHPTLRAQGFTAQFVAEPVPEPATWLLLATGLVGLLGYGWRKRLIA